SEAGQRAYRRLALGLGATVGRISLDCAACGTTNDAGRRFCIECGAPLVRACPTCGAANPPAAKFCGECGTAMTVVAAVPAADPAGPVPQITARRGRSAL